MPRWVTLCLIGMAAAAAAPVGENDSPVEGSGEVGLSEMQGEGSGEVEEQSIVANNKLYIGQQTFRLPFMTRLEQPFVNGQTVQVLGTINRMPTEIEFAFHKGSDKSADKPLHLAVRFDEETASSKVIYNTFFDGTWGEKEQTVDSPFQAGKDFDLRIRIIDNKYHVFANRKDIGTFNIQGRLDEIDHVSIRGDLDYLHLFRYGGQEFPEHYAAIASLTPGKRLDISGVSTGKRFNVNLYRESKEYALQLSFRFHEKVIARNAQENNVWGKEARNGGFPLNKGEVFELTLINEESAMQIFVNGKLFNTFKHRGNANDYKTIEVEGDVELHSVMVKDVVKA